MCVDVEIFVPGDERSSHSFVRLHVQAETGGRQTGEQRLEPLRTAFERVIRDVQTANKVKTLAAFGEYLELRTFDVELQHVDRPGDVRAQTRCLDAPGATPRFVNDATCIGSL